MDPQPTTRDVLLSLHRRLAKRVDAAGLRVCGRILGDVGRENRQAMRLHRLLASPHRLGFAQLHVVLRICRRLGVPLLP